MKKYIGIISRPDKNLTNKNVFIVGEELKNIILDNNYIPLGIIPNIQNIENKLNKDQIIELNNILSMCNGIIMQGGNDYYDYDRVVLKYAIDNDIPIIGICLGMQVMASYKTDNLIDIDLFKYNSHNINSKYVHDIIIDKNSKLHTILQKNKIKVNSTHNQRVKDSGIYKVSAYSNDGIIEAIEYDKNKFNIGIQFHPEKLYKDKNMNKIFKAFFDTIKRD